MNDTIGGRIRTVRTEQNLTQKELAQQIGVPYQTLQFWENGKRNPKIDNLQKIADALDVDVTWLLRGGTAEQQTAFVRHARQKKASAAALSALHGALDAPAEGQPEPDAPDASPDGSRLETELLAYFHTLNPRGQQVAVERLGELVQLPAYRNPDPETR